MFANSSPRYAGWALLILCFNCPLQPDAQAQVVLKDGDFAAGDWVSKKLSDTGSDSFTVTTETSGGNPGAYRRVIHMAQNGAITVSHLPLNGTKLAYSPQQQGAIQAISYSYNVKVITGGQGQKYQFILSQDGNTYAAPRVDQTDALTSWFSFPVSSPLNSSSFF
jgi:hypothetical protein